MPRRSDPCRTSATEPGRRRPPVPRLRRRDRAALEPAPSAGATSGCWPSMYLVTALGITIGYHRLLTHRSFQTSQAGRVRARGAGSMAVQGPVIDWVADHRKHHAHTDEEGDPHSPHVGHGDGCRRAHGLWHAHVGWLFDSHGQADRASATRAIWSRTAGMRCINRHFPWLVVARAADPVRARLRCSTGTLDGALTGAALGRLRAHLPAPPRHLVDQLGLPLLRPPPLRRRRPLDQRLLARAAVARRGLAPQPPRVPALRGATACSWWELDPSGALIRAMRRLGLAWNVVQISPSARRRRPRRSRARRSPPSPRGSGGPPIERGERPA